ncbi:GATA zinc finger domain-containing protein 14-like [Schistocerca cancellata]|uniref:GATA zinc finger domain-containing protein 14-like n=1 Tax=Schistocerca cancellata TaxID=274614 RepID=UPI0021199A7A|nr:GATA zinc finger domain-containing protein 14-like [Schistocerca cancellata]
MATDTRIRSSVLSRGCRCSKRDGLPHECRCPPELKGDSPQIGAGDHPCPPPEPQFQQGAGAGDASQDYCQQMPSDGYYSGGSVPTTPRDAAMPQGQNAQFGNQGDNEPQHQGHSNPGIGHNPHNSPLDNAVYSSGDNQVTDATHHHNNPGHMNTFGNPGSQVDGAGNFPHVHSDNPHGQYVPAQGNPHSLSSPRDAVHNNPHHMSHGNPGTEISHGNPHQMNPNYLHGNPHQAEHGNPHNPGHNNPGTINNPYHAGHDNQMNFSNPHSGTHGNPHATNTVNNPHMTHNPGPMEISNNPGTHIQGQTMGNPQAMNPGHPHHAGHGNPHQMNPHSGHGNPHQMNPHSGHGNPHQANPGHGNPHQANPGHGNPHQANPGHGNPHPMNPGHPPHTGHGNPHPMNPGHPPHTGHGNPHPGHMPHHGTSMPYDAGAAGETSTYGNPHGQYSGNPHGVNTPNPGHTHGNPTENHNPHSGYQHNNPHQTSGNPSKAPDYPYEGYPPQVLPPSPKHNQMYPSHAAHGHHNPGTAHQFNANNPGYAHHMGHHENYGQQYPPNANNMHNHPNNQHYPHSGNMHNNPNQMFQHNMTHSHSQGDVVHNPHQYNYQHNPNVHGGNPHYGHQGTSGAGVHNPGTHMGHPHHQGPHDTMGNPHMGHHGYPQNNMQGGFNPHASPSQVHNFGMHGNPGQWNANQGYQQFQGQHGYGNHPGGGQMNTFNSQSHYGNQAAY